MNEAIVSGEKVLADTQIEVLIITLKLSFCIIMTLNRVSAFLHDLK